MCCVGGDAAEQSASSSGLQSPTPTAAFDAGKESHLPHLPTKDCLCRACPCLPPAVCPGKEQHVSITQATHADLLTC
jgi:hypothetical protein